MLDINIELKQLPPDEVILSGGNAYASIFYLSTTVLNHRSSSELHSLLYI